LEKICRKKSQQSTRKFGEVFSVTDGDATVPKLKVAVSINDAKVLVKLDTATAKNFLSLQDWERLGKPELSEVQTKYQSASKHVCLSEEDSKLLQAVVSMKYILNF